MSGRSTSRAVYSYDDAGAVTKTLLGNASYTEYLSDGVGRLTLLSNKKSDTSVISSFAYTLDATGNRVGMAIAGSAYTSADVDYTYDDAYQLTGEVRTGGDAYSQYFYYDASGNRTKKTLGGTDTLYVYNNGDQLTSETTGGVTTTYDYDPNGALTKADDGTTVQSYQYNCEGRMTAYAKSGGSTAAYAYDADGRRIAKTVDAATTKFFYDGSDAVADYDGSDTLLATYLTPGLDKNLSQTRSGSTYYYMKDGLGSIRSLVDSSETTQNTYDYYAFGKELGSWTEGVTNRYTYTAREWDEESAQYYYRARYYDGGGRFLARDPLSPFGYVYVSHAPLTATDPFGLAKGMDKYHCCSDEPDGSDAWKMLHVSAYILAGSNALDAGVSGDFDMANSLWEQCCIRVNLDDVVDVEASTPGASERILGADLLLNPVTHPREVDDLATLAPPANRVYAFFIMGFGNAQIGGFQTVANGRNIVAVGNSRKRDSLAHELGHSLGLPDLPIDEEWRHKQLMYQLRTYYWISPDQCDSARMSGLLEDSVAP